MSDTAHEVRRRTPTRVRGLGDAVPVFRPFRDDSNDIKIVPKSSDELRAESEARRDAQPMTTRCAVDDCDWTHTGTAGDCRIEAATHRASRHPQFSGASTRKRGVHFKRRGEQVDPATVAESRRLRQEKDDATRLETINRGRAARGELLEETASTGDVGAASSSGTLDSLAAAQPEPPAAAATTTVADPAAAAPTGEQPSGPAAASTSHIQEVEMENKYGLARAGRGFKWTTVAAIQAVRDFHEAVGRPPQQQDSRDEPTGTLPSEAAATQLFGGWDELVKEAGFDPVDRRQQRARGVAATTKKTSPVPAPPAGPQAPPGPQLLTEPVVAEQSVAVLAAELEQAGVDLAAARERYTAARAALASHPTIAQLQEEAAA